MSAVTERPDADQSEEQELCLQCLQGNLPGSHFCRKCGAQLSAYAAIGPFEALFAEGNVYRRAAEQPQRLIVVVGIWLIFGIGVWTGIGMALASRGRAAFLGVAAGIALAALSLFIILKCSRNYRKRHIGRMTPTIDPTVQ